jgi:hypothetical protein
LKLKPVHELYGQPSYMVHAYGQENKVLQEMKRTLPKVKRARSARRSLINSIEKTARFIYKKIIWWYDNLIVHKIAPQ